MLPGDNKRNMTEQALNNLSLTGSMLIFCVGVNQIWGASDMVKNF